MNIYTIQGTSVAAIIVTWAVSIASVASSSAAPLSDFSLFDKNTSSPRYGDSIAPSQYRQEISAWYFGSAT